MAKPPPLDRPLAPPPRGRSPVYPRPFPVLTPQSYVPGAAGAMPYPAYPPARSSFPMLSPNSYLPPMGTMEPPIMNFSGGMVPPPMPYAPMAPSYPSMPPPPPMPMAPPPPSFDPGLRSCSHRRPVRICRRRRRRSRRRRPVVHIVDSSSCSSLSTCSTVSSCSRRRHRSRPRSRRCSAPAPQQPIILLPIPSQQSAVAPAQNQIQQQPQQIILPPVQLQQPGPCQPQQLALPPMPIQQQQFALPPIQIQQQQPQQHMSLPPIQLSSSNNAQYSSSSPIIIPSGQPMIQPCASLPQVTRIAQPQQMQSGAIQYVQAMPQSSSPLQYITSDRRPSVAPQRSLVNSTNKRGSSKVKAVSRSASLRDLPQNDLKFGRRPFDWYQSDKKNNIIDEKIQLGHRGSAAVH